MLIIIQNNELYTANMFDPNLIPLVNTKNDS